MKNNVFKFSLLALACVFAFILNSCSKEELTVTQETDLVTTVDNTQTRTSGTSANGQGTLTNADGSTRHFSFHAIENNNGNVEGSGVITYTAGGLRVRFDIDCLSVRDGNMAIMTGIITEYSLNPFLVGWGCYFRVEDNGEGSNSDPDQITLMTAFPPFASLDCSIIFLTLNPIEGGNIQVKP